MEKIYRGYPNGLSAMEAGNTPVWGWGLPQGADQTEQPAPYMLYRRDSRKEAPQAHMTRQKRMAEMEYFKGLYPLSMRKRQMLVEEACDRLDYMGSPMFDEYPDRETMYRIRDRIGRRAVEMGMEPAQDITQILLVNEMNRRRMLK